MDLSIQRDQLISGAAVVAILLIAGLCLWLWLRSRSRQRAAAEARQQAYEAKVAELTALLKRIESGDMDAYDELRRRNLSYSDSWEEFVYRKADDELRAYYNAVKQQADRRADHLHVHAKASAILADYRQARGHQEQIDALVGYIKALQASPAQRTEVERALGMTMSEAMLALDTLISQYYEALLAAARNSDSASFLLLDKLIEDTRLAGPNRREYNRQFYDIAVTPLSRPDGWNDLVAANVENPELRLFERGDVAPGDLLHMAVKAEDSGTLADMLLVLAYWNAGGHLKSEVPPQIIASLARKIVALREETKRTAN